MVSAGTHLARQVRSAHRRAAEDDHVAAQRSADDLGDRWRRHRLRFDLDRSVARTARWLGLPLDALALHMARAPRRRRGWGISKKWGREDSNLRRLSRRVYSPFPLATRAHPRARHCSPWPSKALPAPPGFAQPKVRSCIHSCDKGRRRRLDRNEKPIEIIMAPRSGAGLQSAMLVSCSCLTRVSNDRISPDPRVWRW